MAIMRKTFDNYDNNQTIDLFNYMFIFNKFTLKVFNWLFYGWQMNKSLVASYLLNLPNYYFLKTIIKIINIILF